MLKCLLPFTFISHLRFDSVSGDWSPFCLTHFDVSDETVIALNNNIIITGLCVFIFLTLSRYASNHVNSNWVSQNDIDK